MEFPIELYFYLAERNIWAHKYDFQSLFLTERTSSLSAPQM